MFLHVCSARSKNILRPNWAPDRRRRRPRATGVAFALGGRGRSESRRADWKKLHVKCKWTRFPRLAASGQPRLGGKTSKTSSPAGLCLMALDHHRLVSACGHPAGTERSTATGGGGGGMGKECECQSGDRKWRRWWWGSPVSQSDATEGSGSVSADKQTQVAV